MVTQDPESGCGLRQVRGGMEMSRSPGDRGEGRVSTSRTEGPTCWLRLFRDRPSGSPGSRFTTLFNTRLVTVRARHREKRPFLSRVLGTSLPRESECSDKRLVLVPMDYSERI